MKKHNWLLYTAPILFGVSTLVFAMCVTVTPIESEAANATRRSNLKSQGVYSANDGAGNNVTLAAQDLVYLADQIDVLEQTVSALSQQQDASIEYNYHKHTGDSVNGGGCYSTGYHAHTSACPYTKKQGREPCPCAGVNYITDNDVKVWDPGINDYTHISKTYAVCTSCGHRREGSMNSHSRSYNYTVYSCGSPINVWVLSCGKTEQTIESAYIVFN